MSCADPRFARLPTARATRVKQTIKELPKAAAKSVQKGIEKALGKFQEAPDRTTCIRTALDQWISSVFLLPVDALKEHGIDRFP